MTGTPRPPGGALLGSRIDGNLRFNRIATRACARQLLDFAPAAMR
jgi:hypothetical protein